MCSDYTFILPGRSCFIDAIVSWNVFEAIKKNLKIQVSIIYQISLIFFKVSWFAHLGPPFHPISGNPYFLVHSDVMKERLVPREKAEVGFLWPPSV